MMKVEVGKYYKTRGKDKAFIAYESNYGNQLPFIGEIIYRTFSNANGWTSEGLMIPPTSKWFGGTLTDGDLISEWTEEDEIVWQKKLKENK
jgi:hypothetical protein